MSPRPVLARWLLALLAVVGGALLTLAPPAAATPWGATGATYSGGILCQLPGATVVPMARWSVNGSAAFSTADVVRRGPLYGAAPTSGFASPIIAGQAGLSGADIAAIAYLIEHHGSGSAAEVAETSADIAALAGGGGTQAQCLGQQGTSQADAAALLSDARQHAGPYIVTVGAPGSATAGGQVAVSATVRSAAGAVTAGLPVRFTAGSDTATAITDSTGVARSSLPVQRATASLQAVVAARTSLTYLASSPPALSPAAATDFTGTGRLVAVTPKPVVQVTGSAGLVLASGKATPTAQVTGTFGYSGSGAITVSGPVQAGTGKACSSLSANAFASAPQIWTAPFTFGGDGQFNAGASIALDAGCYVARATVTTTESVPPVQAASTIDANAVFTVADVSLTQTGTATVAPVGPLAATVTATAPSRASVSTSLTARGPLATSTGDCTDETGWADAPLGASSDPVDLATRATASSSPSGSTTIGPGTPSAQPGDTDITSLAATVQTPTVSRTGCYSLVSRTTVTLDGKSITVEGKPGTTGSTTLVAAPRLIVANAAYDGELGRPMTGTVTVSGTFAFAGKVDIGLLATKVPDGGCHPVTFASRATVVTPTVAATKGDGVYRFRSPKPTKNLCYSVTALLHLDVNPAVRSNTTGPAADTIFLAGVSLTAPPIDQIPDLADRSLLRPVLTLSITYGLLFLTALLVVLKAVAARRPAPTG